MKRKKKRLPSHKHVGEVHIKTAEMNLLLSNFVNDVKQKNDWLAWMGIFVSLLSTILFTEFKPVGGFSADTVRIIYGSLTLLTFGKTLHSIYRCLQINRKDSVDYIMDRILENSQTPYEFRLLYILERSREVPPRILVFWDELYGCYMLPHHKNDKSNTVKEVKDGLGEYLGIPSDRISIEFYPDQLDKVSKKYSEYHQKTTLYYFSFCSARIQDMPQEFLQDSFEFEGYRFAWMSCQMLDHDEGTANKNRDVIRHISDNSQDFFQ